MGKGETLGGRVRRLRALRGWSTTVLAARLVDRGCHIGQSKVTSLETGKKASVSVETVVALADALDTTTDYLLGRTSDPTPKR